MRRRSHTIYQREGILSVRFNWRNPAVPKIGSIQIMNNVNKKRIHVPFSGSLLKHPHDSEKIICVAHPHSSNTIYYKFRKDDISFLEKFPNIVSLNGKIIRLARLWVKKRSIGIQCTPFTVNAIRKI